MQGPAAAARDATTPAFDGHLRRGTDCTTITDGRVQPRNALQPLLPSLRHSNWFVAAIFLATYVVLEWISFIHIHKGVPITPWDPGLGVVFALMVGKTPLAGAILFAGVILEI